MKPGEALIHAAKKQAEGELEVHKANIEVYKTGNIFNLGDKVLYQGSLYRASREQSPQDAIYPNTGINHWFTVGAFSDINCFVYKAISNVSAGSKILPNTGFNHWLKQTPDVSDKYKLYATGYDFVISIVKAFTS